MKDGAREDAPLLVRVAGPDGEYDVLARAVIDASGTIETPGALGASGLPALGEREAADHIFYGIPDVLGTLRHRYAGRRVLVVGSGHSALLAFTAPMFAQPVCTTIQAGTLLNSAGETLTTGYDNWGYNYQARIFNGTYCDAYQGASWRAWATRGPCRRPPSPLVPTALRSARLRSPDRAHARQPIVDVGPPRIASARRWAATSRNRQPCPVHSTAIRREGPWPHHSTRPRSAIMTSVTKDV